MEARSRQGTVQFQCTYWSFRSWSSSHFEAVVIFSRGSPSWLGLVHAIAEYQTTCVCAAALQVRTYNLCSPYAGQGAGITQTRHSCAANGPYLVTASPVMKGDSFAHGSAAKPQPLELGLSFTAPGPQCAHLRRHGLSLVPSC